MDIDKTTFGFIAVILDCLAHLPYLAGLCRGTVKPHAFTWLIWALLTTTTALMQVQGGAAAGAWLLMTTAAFSWVIFLLSVCLAEKDITRGDWIALLACLFALPLYFMLHRPVLAALAITCIDIVSFYPMLRKSLAKPAEESAVFQAIMVAAYGCSLAAITAYSIPTTLYPAMMVFMHGSTALFLVNRKRMLGMAKMRNSGG